MRSLGHLDYRTTVFVESQTWFRCARERDSAKGGIGSKGEGVPILRKGLGNRGGEVTGVIKAQVKRLETNGVHFRLMCQTEQTGRVTANS